MTTTAPSAQAAAPARSRKRILIPLAGLVVAATITVGSGADFIANSVNTTNAYSTGTLLQQNSKAGNAIFNLSNLKPGDTVNGKVTITNSGTLAAAFSLSENAVNGFADKDNLSLTITQGGKAYHFRVEVARSDAEQTQGLMFRQEMGADEGMLFPRKPARVASFWMRNTVIPLDMIFVGTDGKILNIAANTVPYSLDSYSSVGPAIAVLELNGGRAAELGIGPGAKVEW